MKIIFLYGLKDHLIVHMVTVAYAAYAMLAGPNGYQLEVDKVIHKI